MERVSLSYRIRRALIGITGYWIFKKIHLPIGADLIQDLIYKFNVHLEIIFDIGAHYGETALFYHREFPAAKIYSFEPVKNSYHMLVKNTQHANNIISFNTAMGDKDGAAEISLFNEYYSPMNSLKKKNQNAEGVREIVSITTVDNFTREKSINKIDLLKIDTEGYETEVLAGAKNILSGGKATAIFAEVGLSNTNDRNTRLTELINLLDNYGYFLVGLYDIDARLFYKGVTYANALFINKNHETGKKYTL